MERKALIASIVLNVFLLLSVLGLSYGWPLFIHVKQVLPNRERHVSFFEAFPLERNDVVFVGDGITDEVRWSELFPRAPVKNRGVEGDTTADVALRIGQIAAHRPAKVFLMVGGGDAAADKTVENTADSYRAILTQLRESAPETDIFVQSILPRGEDAHDDLRRRNEAIRQIAAEHAATYLDLFPLFVGDDRSIRRDLSNDKVHLLGPGLEVWRDALAPHVGGADDS